MVRNRYFVAVLICLVLCMVFSSCSTEVDYTESAVDSSVLRESMSSLTDVIVHDIFSPPVASRIYAYTSVAAYEAGRFEDPSLPSLSGQLNGLESLPLPDTSEIYDFRIAALEALSLTGRALIFSEDQMEELMASHDSLYEAEAVPASVIFRSKAFGKQVSDAVLAWADKDNYKETRSAEKFTIRNIEDRWKPTPPVYMEAIEPSWREIRTFVIDSAQQFRPPFPTDYSLDPESQFYKETVEVYDAVRNAGEEERAIASFWDCNPYAVRVTGHVMTAAKKITPGGHWMEIVSIASRDAEQDFQETSQTYALVSICLADAFISCWDEKYRSNLIRPETVINEYIDDSWQPILQTPPFPEYTSGHSVISSAAAICLTELLGENFAFSDDSENKYGLPTREFGSFLEASEEAAISRLYGGIHYRPAIDNGVTQGRALGRFIMKELDF